MIKRLRVSLAFSPEHEVAVGEMLRSKGVIYFQFDPLMLHGPLSLSPFKMPNTIAEPQTPLPVETSLFDGLFGVFADSLPDGWGLMMMSRAMKRAGRDFAATTALDRLAFVGRRAIGALVYEPIDPDSGEVSGAFDLGKLAAEVQQFLSGNEEDILPELMVLGGSPGGARPKVLVGVETQGQGKAAKIVAGIDSLPDGFEHWLVKFNGRDEPKNAGIVEYLYSKLARHVGIAIPEARLFSAGTGRSLFGTKRFDRGPRGARIHVHTAAGLVHANFRLPSLDYEDLLKLTSALTRNEDDLLAAFRLAAFNVIFHNRDDHAKNISFLMDSRGDWRLAPAYDLTYSSGPGGEHSTAILGEGRAPTVQHLTRLAERRGIDRAKAHEILEEMRNGSSYLIELFRQYEIKKHPVLKLL